MSLLTSSAKISSLRRPGLNGDVSSRDQRRISRVRLDFVELPCPKIRCCVFHTKVSVVSEGHLYFGLIQNQRAIPEKKVKRSDPLKAIDDELSKIVGLDKLKVQLRKWLKGMLLDERRRAIGLEVGPRRLPQLAFLGNPGTGKTMKARTLSKLLHMGGILSKDKVIEIQRTDLVGEYIGETGPKTREKIEEAEGGILFVDEAYRLVPTTSASYGDYGLEALEEIMSFMDKEKFVVIFAGYTEPMDRVISSNEGMRRRISNIFHFDDFSCEQLAKILHLKEPNKDKNSPFYGFKLDSSSTSVKEVAALIERGTSVELRGKMNGGLVDQMLAKAIENLDSRIDIECNDEDSMVAITSEDLAAGLKSLRDEEKRGNRNGNYEHMVRRIFHLTSDPKASDPVDGPGS